MSTEVEVMELWLSGYCFGPEAPECNGPDEAEHFWGCPKYKEKE